MTITSTNPTAADLLHIERVRADGLRRRERRLAVIRSLAGEYAASEAEFARRTDPTDRKNERDR